MDKEKMAEISEIVKIAENKNMATPVICVDKIINVKSTGFEDVTIDDMAVPYISLLQDLSDAVLNGTPEAIKGRFFLSTSKKVLIPPVRVVICGFKKVWSEWDKAVEGNYITEHTNPNIVLEAKRHPENGRLMLTNGHRIDESQKYFVMILHDDGTMEKVVLKLKYASLKAGRNLMTRLKSLTIPFGNELLPLPMYASIWTMDSFDDQNKEGKKYKNFKFSFEKFIDNELVWKQCKKFCEEAMGCLVKEDIVEEKIIHENEIPF